MSDHPFKKTALAIMAAVMAATIAPPRAISPSAWAAENFVLPDGPYKGRKFDPRITPYLVEPLNFWSDACPDNKDVLRKSKQIGATTMAIIATSYTAVIEPADVFLIEPTDANLTDFLNEKLQRAIDDTPALKAAIAPQTSRSGGGTKSTTYVKRYAGGSLLMGIATSTADLRGKTRKKVIRDEASEYPEDLDGQGSPHDMIGGAYESFLVAGDWKDLWISTPVIKGACAIDREFEAGDQRFWHVSCPGCASKFPFKWNLDSFKFNETFPHNAHYIAPCCGTVIEGHQRTPLVQNAEHVGGGWVATAPGAGKHRSRHFDALSSPFVPWDTIASRWIEARNNPAKLKTFYNLVLGLAYEITGDAPDHEILMARRETFRRGHIPPRVLLLTTAADIQLRGIFVETVGWAANGESWVIDADVLAGGTEAVGEGAFAELAKWYDREYPDAWGGKRKVDAFGVDSGFRSHVVYAWCRGRNRAYALDGRDGWNLPALGMPVLKDINMDGRRVVGGVKLWPVGTWPLKGVWYDQLGLQGVATSDLRIDPPGYVHFGDFLDSDYFLQVTAEYLADVKIKGRISKRWQPRGKQANHFLDCRIYNMALADHIGLSTMTADEWRLLARERASPLLDQPELFAPRSQAIQAATMVQSVKPETSLALDDPPRRLIEKTSSAGWLGRDISDWLGR